MRSVVGSHRGWSSSAPALLRTAVATVVAVGALAGCGGGGGAERTGPVPPDRLVVTAEGGGIGHFRIDLDCAIADRDACAGVLAAIASADDPERCEARDGGDRSLAIEGMIGGEEVRALLRRRTDCEVDAYDAAARAVGL